MLNDLTAKIDAIPLTTTAIPDEDQAALQALDADLQQQLAELAEARQAISALDANNAWVNTKRQALLDEISKDVRLARHAHVNAVINHFNSRHGLRLDPPLGWQDEIDPLPSEGITQQVTKWVQAELGSKDFLELATEKLTSEFHKTIGRVKRSRRILTFERLVHVKDYDGVKELHYTTDEVLYVLARALGRFERSSAQAPSGLAHRITEATWRHDAVPFGQPILTLLERSTQLVIYQNGNVKVTFKTEADAAAFATYYRLQLTT